MDSITKAKLKRLIEHPDWEVIYTFQSKFVESLDRVQIKADDEFNTMWNMAYKIGKIEGLKEFLDNAEKLALDND